MHYTLVPPIAQYLPQIQWWQYVTWNCHELVLYKMKAMETLFIPRGDHKYWPKMNWEGLWHWPIFHYAAAATPLHRSLWECSGGRDQNEAAFLMQVQAVGRAGRDLQQTLVSWILNLKRHVCRTLPVLGLLIFPLAIPLQLFSDSFNILQCKLTA